MAKTGGNSCTQSEQAQATEAGDGTLIDSLLNFTKPLSTTLQPSWVQ